VSEPAVSVVIPTHGRETRLAFALEALAAQTLDRDRFEVIVVRSAATMPPFAEAPAGLRVTFLTSDRASRPGQRNVGIEAARGELIAFTDDDCRPAPGWLGALLAARDGGRGFIQGRTLPDPDEVHLLHGLARSQTVDELGPWYPTCNVAYPRALLAELGGFDEEFVASSEDTDLALRAIESGADALFAPEALVHHAVLAQPLHGALREGWERWWTAPLLFRRHPDHRRHLWRRVFFGRRHAELLLLVAGLAVRRRHPLLAAAAAIPYAAGLLDPGEVGPRRLARHLIHLPARAAYDTAIAAGLVRGSIRYRSPVL
jgi:glycosyltransferase involved in cell wall biosynthesis